LAKIVYPAAPVTGVHWKVTGDVTPVASFAGETLAGTPGFVGQETEAVVKLAHAIACPAQRELVVPSTGKTVHEYFVAGWSCGVVCEVPLSVALGAEVGLEQLFPTL
jgi:hypothetical protein